MRMATHRRLGRSAYQRGDFAEGVARSERALADSHEMGVLNFISVDDWGLGECLLMTGDAARAREVLEHGAEIVKRMGYRGQIPELSSRAALACLRLGDRDAARRHMADAKASIMPLDIEAHRAMVTAEAAIMVADGDVAGAERILRDEIVKIEPTGYRFELAMARLALGELLVDQGRGADARAQLDKAREFFSDPLARGWQERIDALLARTGVPAR